MRWRTAGLVVAAAAVMLGLSACQAAMPIGVAKNGDRVTILVGRQCRDTSPLLSRVRVYNYDRARHTAVGPPLWEIEAAQPRPVHRLDLGTVPEGFTVTSDNIAAQGVGATIDLHVWLGDEFFGMLFDLGDARSGKVLDDGGNLITEAEFERQFGCG